jgi:hypothetical protein
MKTTINNRETRSKCATAVGLAALSVFFCLVGCHNASKTSQINTGSRYLYIWMGDKDEKDDDFIAVLDVLESSPTYGKVLTSQPVGLKGSMPHHFEYELPAPGQLLFGNAHHLEKLIMVDFSDPLHPRVSKTLDPVPPYHYPHDISRLLNGHVLVGYLRSDGPSPTAGDNDNPGNHGGIAELDAQGIVIRTASAAVPGYALPIRTYALTPMPKIDRLITTSAVMMENNSADVVQVWRLSDLKLLNTLEAPVALLPNGKPLVTHFRKTDQPSGKWMPFEPRVMRDGSVLLNAYGCGFYRLTNIDSAQPKLDNVYTINVPASSESGECAVPYVVNHYWLMPVGSMHAVLSLDISDPAHPVEVSRIVAPGDFASHWLAKDPNSNRLILGQEVGYENRMLMLRVDPETGRIWWDESFRSEDGSPGFSFVRNSWPHGKTGEATGHAALFVP